MATIFQKAPAVNLPDSGYGSEPHGSGSVLVWFWILQSGYGSVLVIGLSEPGSNHNQTMSSSRWADEITLVWLSSLFSSSPSRRQ